MIDHKRARELFKEAHARRIRITLGVASASILVGAGATYLISSALPLMGFIVGVMSIFGILIATTMAWVLNEPVSHDLEEFAEIVDPENHIR